LQAPSSRLSTLTERGSARLPTQGKSLAPKASARCAVSAPDTRRRFQVRPPLPLLVA
jgi:hypothetical protein